MPIEKIKVVINRVGLEDTQISMHKAQETIGRDIFAQIPNDYPIMVESRNNGVPLLLQAPKAKLTKVLEQLVMQLDASVAVPADSQPAKSKRRLFSFLGQK
jgi:pilus assembly protein CpaE